MRAFARCLDYERDWAKVLREAGIEVRIVDPKRVRSFARSAGRLAKNDPIDAQMIVSSLKTWERTGSRPSAAGGGGAQRQP